MTVYLGDDWPEDHHDVHLMNEQGGSLAAKRLPESLEGLTASASSRRWRPLPPWGV